MALELLGHGQSGMQQGVDLMERTLVLVLLDHGRNLESSVQLSEPHFSCLQNKGADIHLAGLQGEILEITHVKRRAQCLHSAGPQEILSVPPRCKFVSSPNCAGLGGRGSVLFIFEFRHPAAPHV